MLNFDGAWRFRPPANTGGIPGGARAEIYELILRTATQAGLPTAQANRLDRQDILERFKGYFSRAAGTTTSRSSSASWAETDLSFLMEQASPNPPLFIEAFYDAWESLQAHGIAAPDLAMMNEVLTRNEVPFRIEPPNLVSATPNHIEVVIHVPPRPPTLAEQAVVVLQRSLQRSEELLLEGRDREAVQEILWLLETVATAFRGLNTTTGTVEGTYFNQIVRELRQNAGRGTSLDQIIDWMTRMHGYLSAPAGGGVGGMVSTDRKTHSTECACPDDQGEHQDSAV